MGAAFLGLLIFFFLNWYIKKKRYQEFEQAQRLRAVTSKRAEKVDLKIEIPRSPTRRPLMSVSGPSTPMSIPTPPPLRQAFSADSTDGWPQVDEPLTPQRELQPFLERDSSTVSSGSSSGGDHEHGRGHSRETVVRLGRSIARKPVPQAYETEIPPPSRATVRGRPNYQSLGPRMPSYHESDPSRR